MMIIGLHLQASAWIWADDNCIYDYVCLQSAFDRPFNLTEGFAVQTPKTKKKVNLQRRICYSLCLWHRFIAIKMVTKIGLLTMCCLIMPVIFGIKHFTPQKVHMAHISVVDFLFWKKEGIRVPWTLMIIKQKRTLPLFMVMEH